MYIFFLFVCVLFFSFVFFYSSCVRTWKWTDRSFQNFLLFFLSLSLSLFLSSKTRHKFVDTAWTSFTPNNVNHDIHCCCSQLHVHTGSRQCRRWHDSIFCKSPTTTTWQDSSTSTSSSSLPLERSRLSSLFFICFKFQRRSLWCGWAIHDSWSTASCRPRGDHGTGCGSWSSTRLRVCGCWFQASF